MKNAIVKLGFCLVFFCLAGTVAAADFTSAVTRVGAATQHGVAFIDYNVVFGTSVTTFANADILLSGAGAAGATAVIHSGSGTSYVVRVTGMTTTGNVTVKIPAGTVTAGADNNLDSNDETVAYDGNPAVAISQVTSDPSVNTNQLVFTVTFDEAVVDFAGSVISFAGSGASMGALSVQSVNATTPNTVFEVTVLVPGAGRATQHVVISVPAGAVHDADGNGNNASTGDGDITYGGVAPTVSGPTKLAVTQTSLRVAGRVETDGGLSTVKGGTLSKSSAGVTENDNRQEKRTGVGDFDHDYTGLTASTQYWIRVYANNGVGGGTGNYVLSPELSFWTLTSEPTEDVDISSVTSLTTTSLKIDFESLNDITGADGMVILRSTADFDITDLEQGIDPDDQAFLIRHLEKPADGGLTTFTDTGLTPNTQYFYAIVPYNTAGGNLSTSAFRAFTTFTGGGLSAQSRLQIDAAAAATIDYKSKVAALSTAADGLTIMTLKIYDGVSAADDVDGQPTDLKTIKIRVLGTTGGVPHHTLVREVGLVDPDNDLLDHVTLDMNGEATLTVPDAQVGQIHADDNANVSGGDQFKIIASFNTTTIDGAAIQVEVMDATTFAGNSDFSRPMSGTLNTGTTLNKIAVVATKFLVSGLPAEIHPDENFGFSVQLLDNNDNVDTNVGGNVTLSLNAADGDLTPAAPSSAVNASGVATFSNLQINVAEDDRRVTIHSTVLTTIDQILLIDVRSVGVTPNGPDLPLCFNSASGTFTVFGPIKIKESNKADFKAGSAQTYSIILPDGFVFHTDQVASPISVTPTNGTAVSQTSFLGYTGSTIARWQYSVANTTSSDLDEITIAGLKVKYIGTTAVTLAPVLRIGGTAVIAGNDEDDAKPHGRLTAQSSVAPGAAVSFKVANPDIDPAATNFSKVNSPAIILQGTKDDDPLVLRNGTFSGPGVSLDTDGKYKFYPNSVSQGNHEITFSYVHDPLTGCISTVTRTFSVFIAVIDGLSTKYCVDAATVTLGDATNFPNVDCFFSVGDKYTFDAYVFGYNLPNQPINWITIGSVRGNTPFNPGSFYNSLPLPPSGNREDYITYVGYRVINNCLEFFFEQPVYYYYDKVDINPLPAAPFEGLPITKLFCETSDAVDITSSVFNFSEAYDDIWSSNVQTTLANASNPANARPGINGDRVAGYEFDPDDGLGSASGSDIVQINFKHRDFNTGCQNWNFQRVTVYEQPDQVSSGEISIRGNNGFVGEFCEDEPLDEFEAATTPGIIYNWYDSPQTRTISAPGNTFNPIPWIPGNTPGSYDFNVTQTLYSQYVILPPFSIYYFAGCESPTREITVVITEKTFIEPLTDVTICAGNPVELDDIHASISSPVSSFGGTWKSKSATQGTFFDDDDDALAPATFPEAVIYEPTTAEWALKNFRLMLTTAEPPGACKKDSLEVVVTVNAGATVSFPENPVRVCAPNEVSVKVEVANAPGFTWTKESGLGDIIGATDEVIAVYKPNLSENASGATIVLNVETVDPDDTGPCEAADADLTIIIDQKPFVEAGPDVDICADQIIQLQGLINDPLSSASTATWSVLGAENTIASPTSLITTYTPSTTGPTAEYPGAVQNPTRRQLVFTLTSNVPAAPNVCPAFADEKIVTIHGVPVQPLATSPDPYCVGENIGRLRAGGTDIKWYDEAFAPLSSGGELSTDLDADMEKTVYFHATQTFGALAPFAGCESEMSDLVITVNPLPDPGFSFVNRCLGEVMEFTDETLIAAPLPNNPVQTRGIATWAWDFDDGTDTDPGSGLIPDGAFARTSNTFKDPHHEFEDVGEYEVTLVVVTTDGCTASHTVTDPIPVGSNPVPNFTVALLCEDDDTHYTGISGLPLAEEPGTNYEWTFGDPASGTTENESLVKNPDHLFSAVGTYDVSLTVTSSLGCTETITRKTSIFPYVKDFPYIENFENANHGWVPSGIVINGSDITPLTSWNLLTSANSITSDPAPTAGSTFWATHTNVDANNFYYDNERSILYGPCVDMTNLSRPVLAMDYFNDTELKGDGVYIEYMDEEAASPQWLRLGDNISGLDWYNESSIGGLSAAGGTGQTVSQFGWSGSTDGWKTGRYNLDDFTTRKRLRLRIVFGSNISPVNTDLYDGFALDYFRLESRNRLVLVENFTSASTSTAVTSNTTAFQNFPSVSASTEVVKIEYHTGLPAQAGDGEDPIFRQNPMDPNARASFYGLSAVPRGYIDGYSNTEGNGMFNGAWANEYYSRESLKTSPIEINLTTPTIVDGTMTIHGTVLATETDFVANNYSIYVAVVEKEVGTDAFVLRKMLPSASGRKVQATPKGGSFGFTETWSIDRSYLHDDNPQLIAVAFVQSDIINADGERPVLQAAYSNAPAVAFTTGIETPFLEQTAMFPNPADKLVKIELPNATTSGVEINVIDQLGRSIIKSAIRTGERSASIDTSGLAGSVYIVQFRENGISTSRKLVVTH